MAGDAMLRVEVTEQGQPSLPAIDLEGAFTIGSDVAARVRLPASGTRPTHVRVDGTHWHAVGPVTVDGAARDTGVIGEGVTLEIGTYRVKLGPAPTGATATPPRRTESLARELVRSMLGTDAAPTLTVERGPAAGAKRMLAPPESILVIGRGDEANWILADDDLSRAHAEIRRGWDGVRIADLGSKNGTKVDGDIVEEGEGVMLSDGATIELGKVVLRFRDPAEKHLRGNAPPPSRRTPTTPPASSRPDAGSSASKLPFYAAITIAVLALGALVWIVSS